MTWGGGGGGGGDIEKLVVVGCPSGVTHILLGRYGQHASPEIFPSELSEYGFEAVAVVSQTDSFADKSWLPS